jgi:membrane protease YdiL (CAAX protease family)
VHGVYAPPSPDCNGRNVAWLALGVLGSLGATTAVYGLLGGDDGPQGGDVVLAAGIVIGLAIVPLIVGWRSPLGWRRTFGFVVSRRAVRVGLIGAVASLTTTLILTEGMRIIANIQGTSTAAETVEAIENPALLATYLVIAVLGASFSEELAFRGLVWGAVLNAGPAPWVATILSAVPFSIIHIEPTRVIPLLGSGIVLGIVRQKGGLAAAILSHMLVNLIPAVARVLVG